MSESEVMQLAKNLDLKQVCYPVVVQEKLDGVPADFSAGADGEIKVRTRQNEDILSVDHIKSWLYGILCPYHHVIGELYIPDVPFKKISGLVRGHQPAPQLQLNIFDYYIEGKENHCYEQRLHEMLTDVGNYYYDDPVGSPVQLIPGVRCENEEAMLYAISKITKHKPESEGAIIRTLNSKYSDYRIGKRTWGLMRDKPVGNADVEVVGFEEAEDAKTGLRKGMLGGISIRYKDQVIGCGPGNLNHKERIEIWNNPRKYLGKIAEIEYKPDPSYEALREPIFKRWRDDKSTPSYE